MFQWLQKLVPLKHLSSEHMIYVQKLKDRNEELEFLKDTFIANDIPINIVDRIFQKYIPQKYRTDGGKIRKRHQLILKNLSKFRMKKDSLIS